MHKCIVAILLLFLSLLPAAQTRAKLGDTFPADKKTGVPTITVIKLDISDKTLNLFYEIRNESEDDAWIFVGWYKFSDNAFEIDAGVLIAEDGHTLTIRARFEEPATGTGIEPCYGRFVRLRSGDSQTESIFVRLPVYLGAQRGHVERQEQAIKHATRLAVELGYYGGNLPEKILSSLKRPENTFPEDPNNLPVSPLGFNWCNERVKSREDELLILEEDLHESKTKDQRVIKAVIENTPIPYEEKPYQRLKIKRPNLNSCIRAEFHYQPSMLEYFFPFTFQQSLLSPDELKHLRSENTFVAQKQDIKAIADDMSNGSKRNIGVVVRYRSHIDVTCYYQNRPPLSFPICNDNVIIGGEQFAYEFPCLKMLTPKIQDLDLRMRCAVNLKNQWYCLRFYNLHEALWRNDPSIRNQTLYPTATQWCDDLLCPYPVTRTGDTAHWDAKPLICPGAGEGKCHYAMNPNCRPDLPANMVLLFETKAGWNQHGGPESFTFDNHDPKGGCVLLNDGTVKFIRTKEELHQLRWK